MAKRQYSVSLTFVLLRYAIVMLGCMLLCFLVWLFCFGRIQKSGLVYQRYTSNQQVEQLLAKDSNTFLSPGDDFLAEYALFSPNGNVLESNVKGKKLKTLAGFLKDDELDIAVLRHTYVDGSTVIFRWHYRAEFVNPYLRKILPPFEYLWLTALGISLVLCLLFNTLWLRGHLASKLKLFGEVSEKVGAQDLDFVIPYAGIREYDRALAAMEHMKKALYNSLSAQWTAKQEREAEIAALAHDLKTPLTIVGGNAELLLDEELTDSSRKMIETILANNERAKQYVTSLLEIYSGADEPFENISLPSMFDEFCESMITIAQTKNVTLQMKNHLKGTANIQKDRLLRALGNVVINSVEHTPEGGDVYLEGIMTDNGWQVTVRDEGPGFSKAALRHATERLWRDNTARGADGHNGLGLWFTAQVVSIHAGQLKLQNWDSGGMVTIMFSNDAIKNR